MKKVVLAGLAALWLSGCSTPAPKYSADYDNVQKLVGVQKKSRVGEFKPAAAGVGQVTLRASSLTSPYGGDLLGYLRTALEMEFEKAGILDPNAHRVVSAKVNKLDIVAEMKLGRGLADVTFLVSKNGREAYQRTIEVTMEWESSFVGAIAIPKAANSLPMLTEKLLNKLYSDPDFIKAISG